jgi:hypothetical protein
LEALGGGLQWFLSFRSRGIMCEKSTSFDFLSVHSPAYLPYGISFYSHYFLLLFENLAHPLGWDRALGARAFLDKSSLAKQGKGSASIWGMSL